jgi:hypothetical protein
MKPSAFDNIISYDMFLYRGSDINEGLQLSIWQIVRHAESWNVSALEAIGQIFTPSFDRPGEWIWENVWKSKADVIRSLQFD